MSYYLTSVVSLLFVISAVSSAMWEITLDNALVICHARSAKECPDLENKTGEWVSSHGPKSNPQWVTKVDSRKIKCLADDVAACPKLSGQSTPWESNQHHSTDTKSKQKKWKIEVNKVDVTCTADKVRECRKAVEVRVKWHRTKGSSVESGQLFYKKGRTELYCNAEISTDCPKLHSGTWEKNKNHKHQDTESVWVIKGKHATITCIAKLVKACPKPNKAPGKWKFEKSEIVDFESRWSTVVGDATLLCRASKINKCPEFINKWSEIAQSNPVPEGTWKMVIPSTTITCHSEKASQCHAEGGFMYQTNDDLSKSAKWFIAEDAARFYCVSNYSTLCPNVGGHVWKENLKYQKSANKELNAWMVNTLPGNLACLAKGVADCPKVVLLHFLKQKWVPKRTTLIELSTFKWITVIDGTTILCSSIAAMLCPHIARHSYWWKKIEEPSDINIDREKIWKMTVPELTITCEAEDIRPCQKGLHVPGDWALDSNKTVQLAKWFNEENEAKFYCDAYSSNKCPKLKDNNWIPNPKRSSEIIGLKLTGFQEPELKAKLDYQITL